jgi:hypothetical protein
VALVAASKACVIAIALLAAGATVVCSAPTSAAPSSCSEQRANAALAARVERVLQAGRDVWGDALLARPGGPTYEAARRHLPPLFLAYGRGRKPLTDSGVHYLPFGQPLGVQGAGSVALHVADGGQVLSQRADGRRLTVFVGAEGAERYGSCLRRLAEPRLLEGYLPVLETSYVDAAGGRYRQQSFSLRDPGTRRLVSFVRLDADTRGSAAASTRVRLEAPAAALAVTVPRGDTRTVFAAWELGASTARTVDEAAFEQARSSVVDYWTGRLGEGWSIDVPDRRVLDAARALAIQNLLLTWRYSIGNPYEQFSFPEGVDVAQVLAEIGFGDVSAAILRTSLTRRPTPYANWKMGEKLLGAATHFRLFRDGAFLGSVTPALRRYVRALGRQIETGPGGLLPRERYSSDIPDQVYGLHSQAVVWQGLTWIGQAWGATGNRELARTCRELAARLRAGLDRAVRASQRRLRDGSLFVPVRLLDDERAYDSLTESRAGSYWNLVMPYALASGIFRPGGPQAKGVLRYMLRHGSRLLGIVRAGAYALYDDPVFPTSGTDQVYGINVARFLATNDEPDQLVLSLYGTLAAAMAPGTFVSGEGATVAPLAGRFHRSMYLPPNGASNAAFLETLRVMLVHETTAADGAPRGLRLAFATPRPWLAPGRSIAVRNVPTSFGPVSYAIEAGAGALRVTLELPTRGSPRKIALRLRLPGGARITGVRLADRPWRRFDPAAETVDLTGIKGSVELAVAYRG